MKADRLLSLLVLLQAHSKLSGRSLAKRLGVSERTVHPGSGASSGNDW